jgi:4-oxalocrotonate tautomerase
MPIITVEMFKGRSTDQKRKLAKGLTDAFVDACGGKPEGLHIVIKEVDKEDWAVGGELCSDKYPD